MLLLFLGKRSRAYNSTMKLLHFSRQALAIVTILTLTACATVNHGPMQRIAVDSDPSGATVRTRDCGPKSTKLVKTPSVIWVSRRADRCVLTFGAPGYEYKSVPLHRKVSEQIFENLTLVNDLCDISCNSLSDWWAYSLAATLLVGTGVGVDALSGAMYEQEPSQVLVELSPTEPAVDP